MNHKHAGNVQVFVRGRIRTIAPVSNDASPQERALRNAAVPGLVSPPPSYIRKTPETVSPPATLPSPEVIDASLGDLDQIAELFAREDPSELSPLIKERPAPIAEEETPAAEQELNALAEEPVTEELNALAEETPAVSPESPAPSAAMDDLTDEELEALTGPKH